MSHQTDDEHDGAASFAAVGTGTRTAQVPPDDGALRLVLVRHGRTLSNVRHRLDTALPGPGLDELGHAQAEEVAGLLAGWPVQGLYASRATRAQETAAPIGRALGREVELLQGLHEVFVGDLEGQEGDDARAAFDEVFEAWWDGDVDRAMPGGESARDVWGRALPDLAAVTSGVTEGAVVVVSHGAAIRILSLALLGGHDGSGPGHPDVTYGRERPVPNTGRVVLRRDPGGWVPELWDAMPGGRRATHR
ncbi:histidine phosphatase family protein [Pseudonocardia alni]|uniref:Phosphoglycerate mutase n=1 Tax=Pseudonocardia alni TaxID=33907 RepID=A0A852W1A8_PSEA5|nr:histidine phosphatase family protein [Pseudonocardia antarctica]NYG02717.1 putative phosphoglycerate mutase [Pseudonocardia antarctica]